MIRFLPLLIFWTVPLLRGGALEIRTDDLPWAIVNSAYRTVIETGVDGRCEDDTVLSLGQGNLPPGMAFRGSALVGIPKKIGRFHLSVRAANRCASVVKGLELVVTGKPVLRIFPETLSCEYRFGKAPPAPLTVQLSATWPDLPYSIEVDVPWLSRKVRAGVTPGTGSGLASDLVSLEVDPKNLAPGVYRASVRFSTWQGANSPVVSVTLKVVE